MRNVTFQELMYGYAAEKTISSNIKIYIPDIFPDKKQGSAIDSKTNNGSAKNIIINANTPSISNLISNKNYIELSTLGNQLLDVNLNDKLLIAFVNCNPNNGIILGKV